MAVRKPVKAYGSQILAEFIACRAELLSHRDQLETLLREGLVRCGLELKSLNSYQFEPIGVTVIAIIGESHVALHTYPEDRHLSLDIFTCSPGSPGPRRLLAFLQAQLEPELVRSKELTRGLSVELLQTDYITDFSRNSFDVRYHIQREVLRQRTEHQQLVIIDNPDFGRMLFLDQELQIAEVDAERYHQALLAPLQGRPLTRCAILGGGDGGVLRALLTGSVQEVFLVDIDPGVIAAARAHLPMICGTAFEDPRTRLVIAEACDFLRVNRGFDAIVCDLTTAPERLAHASKASYFPALFQQISKCLNPGGQLVLQVGSELDRQSHAAASTWLSPYFVELRFEAAWIPSFCEAWLFGSATKA
ncbi:MAG: adenosylmethionine decarboxylase [Candidatus Melainabacteria bacterium HGW-Melainabacteria-1]|nr:MAG: adenosylmethionine decarboxylase [Candidatus Melainabacteria bacterium HGW-Melainabacteria-1]